MADLTIFGATYADVLQKVRGVAVADAAEAGTDVAGQAAIEKHMSEAYSKLLSGMPARYRKMIDDGPSGYGRVSGELFERTTTGQTDFTLSLETAQDNDNLIVWVGLIVGLNRATRDAAEDSVSLTGQVVTINSVQEDEWVVIQYDHDGTSFDPDTGGDNILQAHFLNLAAWQFAREVFEKVTDGAIIETLQSNFDETEKWMDDVMNGDKGIAILDKVKLYEDWDLPRRGAQTIRVERQ